MKKFSGSNPMTSGRLRNVNSICKHSYQDLIEEHTIAAITHLSTTVRHRNELSRQSDILSNKISAVPSYGGSRDSSRQCWIGDLYQRGDHSSWSALDDHTSEKKSYGCDICYKSLKLTDLFLSLYLLWMVILANARISLHEQFLRHWSAELRSFSNHQESPKRPNGKPIGTILLHCSKMYNINDWWSSH
jgi:hypothetical protein